MNVYEGYGLREDGSIFTVEIIEAEDDASATAIAKECAIRWAAKVELYRADFLNLSSDATPEENLHLVTTVGP